MQARYQEFHGKIPFMPNDIYVQYSRYMCVMKRDLTRFLFKYVHVACYLFLAFAFCRFCKVICFFPSEPKRLMTSDFEGFSIPDIIHYIFSRS